MCNTFAYFILFTLTSDSFGYVEPQIISLHSETSSDNEKTKLFFGKKYINKKIEELDEHNEDDNYANWRKHDNKHVNIRRRYSSSSETEEKIHWKDEWKEKWKNIKKLADSMNMSNVDKGDRVNMVAARKYLIHIIELLFLKEVASSLRTPGTILTYFCFPCIQISIFTEA